MTRVARLVAMVVLAAQTLVGPVPAVAAATRVTGGVTVTVDDRAKTITFTLNLTIYAGCSGDPAGEPEDRGRACTGGAPALTAGVATRIKEAIERYWNDGHRYRCYTIRVVVNVQRAYGRGDVATGRIGVRMDPTVGGIRDYVDGSGTQGTGPWDSNDPSDRVEPTNDGEHETTWSQDSDNATYAHEAGHVMGLDDTYVEIRDAQGHLTGTRTMEGAPDDLMSGHPERIDQRTLDLLVERNQDRLTGTDQRPYDIDDLKCDFTLKVKIRMAGTNPAFKAIIRGTGEIVLKPKGGAMPLGTGPIDYEGQGTVAYTVQPDGQANCTFGYEGSGSFTVNVRAMLTLPIKPDDLEVFLFPDLTALPKDTLIAWPCGTKVHRQKVVPLFTLFYTDRLGAGRSWKIDDWDATTSFDKHDVADGYYDGFCARHLCRENDDFVLAEVP